MTDRLSPAREAEITARAQAAHPGPWRRSDEDGSLERYVLSEDDLFAISFGYRGNNTQAEADFVAHARQDVPALLAELAAVRAERDQAQDRIVELEEQRDRRRVRLIAAEADLLAVRGLLSPAGQPRRIPADIQIHERVAPAVEWLLNRITELEAQLGESGRAAALADTEQQFLRFALNLAADEMASRSNEFDSADEKALKKLRHLADEGADE